MKTKVLSLLVLSANFAFCDTVMLESITVSEIADNSTLKDSVFTQEKGRSNNIGDFISDDTEINLNRKTSFGDDGSTLLLRGQSGNRIALNIDGANMNSLGEMGAAYIDFGSIPMDNIEKIDILKGGSSVEYGNILGGVINVYTKKPKQKPYFSLYTTTGGWDDIGDFSNIRTSFSKRYKNIGISLGASHQEADAYLWNNDYESTSISSRFYYFAPYDGELSFGVLYSDTTRGLVKENSSNSNFPFSLGESFAGGSPMNNVLSKIGKGADVRKKKTLLDVSYTQPISDVALLELNAYKNRENRTEKNYADDSGTTYSAGDLVFQRDIKVDNTYGIKAKSTIFLDSHEILFGGEYKYLKGGKNTITYLNAEYNDLAWGPTLNNSVGETEEYSKIKLKSIFLGDSYNLSDNLTFKLGARYDKYDAKIADFTTNDGKLTPKIGLEYSLSNNDIFGLYLYQTFRAPGSTELYHYTVGLASDYDQLKNKELKAESANAIDFTYKHNFSQRNFIKASLYYYDVKDYINFKDDDSGHYAYNIDHAKFFGVTLNGAYGLSDDFLIRGGVTYQKTKKDGDVLDVNNISTRIDYVPNIKANLAFDYDILANLKSSLAVNYTGTRYYEEDLATVHKLDDYATVDLSFSYKITKNIEVELYGENILDKDYYTKYGYPSTGAVMGASFKYVY